MRRVSFRLPESLSMFNCDCSQSILRAKRLSSRSSIVWRMYCEPRPPKTSSTKALSLKEHNASIFWMSLEYLFRSVSVDSSVGMRDLARIMALMSLRVSFFMYERIFSFLCVFAGSSSSFSGVFCLSLVFDGCCSCCVSLWLFGVCLCSCGFDC